MKNDEKQQQQRPILSTDQNLSKTDEKGILVTNNNTNKLSFSLKLLKSEPLIRLKTRRNLRAVLEEGCSLAVLEICVQKQIE